MAQLGRFFVAHFLLVDHSLVYLDDVLWCFAFALTVWYFDLPMKLLIDPRINRFCLATWNLWSFWSIYIVFVTFMFTIVVVSLV
uniref:Uncharacterized protein n=1 Tax=Parascaris equorum TaxID=6256 RepID=A0A914RKS9_PAREQ